MVVGKVGIMGGICQSHGFSSKLCTQPQRLLSDQALPLHSETNLTEYDRVKVSSFLSSFVCSGT